MPPLVAGLSSDMDHLSFAKSIYALIEEYYDCSLLKILLSRGGCILSSDYDRK